MKSVRAAVSLPFLALAMLLPACGGGDSTTTVVLGKAAIIKRGDAICTRSDKQRVKEAVAYIKAHPSVTKAKDGQKELVTEVALPRLEAELAELKKLEPSSDAPAYGAIISAFETAIAKIKTDPVSVANPKTSPLKQADSKAKAFGFKACSSLL